MKKNFQNKTRYLRDYEVFKGDYPTLIFLILYERFNEVLRNMKKQQSRRRKKRSSPLFLSLHAVQSTDMRLIKTMEINKKGVKREFSFPCGLVVHGGLHVVK